MTHPATRVFPLLLSPEERKAGLPRSIPWSLAERAYADYSRRYGTSQSLERLAERGGFGPTELDVHVPGWRKEVGL
ncbi:hypothetical protein COSO111634_16555 [Corallococcus soli]